MASFQILGATPLEKLSLKMDNSSALAIRPKNLEKGKRDVVRAHDAFASHGVYGCVEFAEGEG